MDEIKFIERNWRLTNVKIIINFFFIIAKNIALIGNIIKSDLILRDFHIILKLIFWKTIYFLNKLLNCLIFLNNFLNNKYFVNKYFLWKINKCI